MLLVSALYSSFISYCWARYQGGVFKVTLWHILGCVSGVGKLVSASDIVNNLTWYINVLLLCYAVFYFGAFLAKRMRVNTNTIYFMTMICGLTMFSIWDEHNFSAPFFTKNFKRFDLLFRRLVV